MRGKMTMRPRIMASTALGEKVKPLPGLSADLRCGAELRYRIVPEPDSISMEHGTCHHSIHGAYMGKGEGVCVYVYRWRGLLRNATWPGLSTIQPRSDDAGFFYMI
jgi:hypothetical protein